MGTMAYSVFGRRQTGFGLAVALFLLGAVLTSSRPLNHDAAWHLYAGGLLRQGQLLYQDILEFNPPMVYWFSILPHWLREATGISEIVIFKGLVLLLVLASAGLAWQVANQQRESGSSHPEYLLALFLFAGLTLTGYDFGQREHLFFLATWPYLIISLGRAAGKTAPTALLIVSGLLAGLGVALKPHFLLLPLAVEGALPWMKSAPAWWRKPETLSALVVLLVYWLVIWIELPNYFEMLRWAAAAYGAFEAEPLRVLQRLAQFPLAALLVAAVVRPSPAWRSRWRLALLVLLVFIVLAVVPMKGWTYHFYPARAMALVVIGLAATTGSRWVLGDKYRANLGNLLGTALPVGLLLLAFAGGVRALWYSNSGWAWSPTARLIRAVEARAGAGPVWVMDTSMTPAFPVVNYADVTWGSRLPFLWPLEGAQPLLPQPSTREARELRNLLFDIVTSDLRDRRPSLVLVKVVDIAGFEETSFNFIDFFSQDERFARIWNNYRLVGIQDFFQLYQLPERPVDSEGEKQ